MSALPGQLEMERAWRLRDASYDGAFFLAVKTTGIFCRPSCAARKPRPENVLYFGTAREALFSGFRPCLRCQPLVLDGRPPQWAANLLSRVEARPQARIKDGDLRALGIEPVRARRHFLKTYGMTFHAYCRARRLSKALEQIRRGARLDDVALGNGYASHSGFRDAFSRAFGKPPGKSRGESCVVVAWIESPLGPLVAGATPEGVCLLEFTDRRMLETQFETLRRVFGCALVPGESTHIERLRRELAEYFAGARRRFTVPLATPAGEFTRRVWDEVAKIPWGSTRTYRDIARSLGAPKAFRAVGRANGSNRVAIVIPCHRVVGHDGRLCGYGGGLWRKQRLLDLEREHGRSPAR